MEKFHNLEIPFESLDLTVSEDRERIQGKYSPFDFLICLDVLEHIKESHLKDILQFFKKVARKQFIIVANHSDVQNGIQLHVTQRPFEWWEELVKDHLQIIESKEIHGGRAYVFMCDPSPTAP